MFTQCPHCQTRYALTSAELREHRGMIRCTHCEQLFDGLQFVCDSNETLSTPKPIKTLPWEKAPTPLSLLWLSALVLNILLLCGQFSFFAVQTLSQYSAYRSYLIPLAELFNYSLPTYRHVDELTILHSSLESQANHTRVLNLTVLNQADFSQAKPNIKLTLFNQAGDKIAQRLLSPVDYEQNTELFAPEASLEISLAIIEPKTAIGGYTVELVY